MGKTDIIYIRSRTLKEKRTYEAIKSDERGHKKKKTNLHKPQSWQLRQSIISTDLSTGEGISWLWAGITGELMHGE